MRNVSYGAIGTAGEGVSQRVEVYSGCPEGLMLRVRLMWSTPPTVLRTFSLPGEQDSRHPSMGDTSPLDRRRRIHWIVASAGTEGDIL